MRNIRAHSRGVSVSAVTGRSGRLGFTARTWLAWIAIATGLSAVAGPVNAQGNPVRIEVPAELSIIPAAAAPIKIEIINQQSVAEGSFVYLLGLPEGSSLSSGFKVTQSSWAVPLGELDGLTLLIPEFSTPLEAKIQVLTPEGQAVADAATMLFPVDGSAIANRPARSSETASAPDASRSTYNGSLSAAQSEPAPTSTGQSVDETQTASVAPVEGPRAISPPPAPTPASPPSPAASETPGQSAPAPEPRRQMTEEERERASRLLAKGDEAMKSGNILAARLYYHRAAKLGMSEAALAMAHSYDAVELTRMRVIGVDPDAELAQTWYARARELGLGR